MKFKLASKTESEQTAGKVQMHFRHVESGDPPPQMGMSAITLSGLWDRVDADSYDVGAEYEMTLTAVVAP